MIESPASRQHSDSVVRRLNGNAPRLLLLLLIVAIILRTLLIVFSPVPFGYVWDFYYEGVRHLAINGRLPAASDCWQCYHPPLYYLLGWPPYALGRSIGSGSADADISGLRWLAGLATVCAAVTIYYGYRLLRLFGCRGASLVIGFALLLTFPCLFISSYGAEADIVLSAVLSAFLYYLTRDFGRGASSISSAVLLGTLAGLAAATKYSGLVAILSGCVVLSLRAIQGGRRAMVIRNLAVMIVTCSVLSGWKYVDNYRRYGTPLFANGTAIDGFRLTRRTDFRRQYEFTTFRMTELIQLIRFRARKGALTDLPIYRSVPTTLHALAWSDMTFFSEPTRHGDPSHPYPRKRIPAALTFTVLVLGFVPEALAAAGFVVTIRRRIFRPVAVMCVISIGAYTWWFISQQHWGLKTKYLLFLLPAFVLYTVVGLAWLSRRAPRAGQAAAVLLAALIVLAHFYLLGFALG